MQFLLGAFTGSKTMPLGIAYAIWSGLGIVLVSIAAIYIYNQKLDLPAIIGMLLIIVGVLVINLFSKVVGTKSLVQNIQAA